jgi:hypothetical protein
MLSENQCEFGYVYQPMMFEYDHQRISFDLTLSDLCVETSSPETPKGDYQSMEPIATGFLARQEFEHG